MEMLFFGEQYADGKNRNLASLLQICLEGLRNTWKNWKLSFLKLLILFELVEEGR